MINEHSLKRHLNSLNKYDVRQLRLMYKILAKDFLDVREQFLIANYALRELQMQLTKIKGYNK